LLSTQLAGVGPLLLANVVCQHIGLELLS
jgi:hypothetical protein